ncbi:integrin alpha-PS3-like isoform X3 [Danaus plexippus]|uniref:integrin alpha-PS3-like isoform X3 n=1 Tax=Danaus plexippus TaxID=13037 RepID=UPI002AB19C69|nr:integrin alpha-PS3-like isoform X3 [Danaus plexippus]
MFILLSFVIMIYFKMLLCECGEIYEVKNKITLKPDDDSKYFGYTVVMDSNVLIVGAPKARSKLARMMATGQIYNCKILGFDVHNVTCYPLGSNGTAQDAIFGRFAGYSDFFRDDMWFGAVIALVPNGKLLICSPRWTNPYKDTHLLANGACYIQAQRRALSLLPLKDMTRQAFMTQGLRKEYGEYGTHLNFYAYGQAGFSAKVTENNSVIIGAPGLLQWTGGIVEYKYYPDPRSVLFGLQPITNPYYTPDLGPDDYLGYSVESGIFEKNGRTLYVAGAPRSKAGYGQVLIIEPSFRENGPLNIKAKLIGHQLGSYFGASMSCTDINGDGISDLMVGAPNFVIHDGSLHYDQGAVFVYLTESQESNFTLIEHAYVFGSARSGSRFGSSIASLGDIDGDGYNDIAIGAPWENDGIGAVYIYRGGADGLLQPFVQKIFVEEARSFGVSISKGVDLTNDNCNELAVGALNSRTAYIFKCIPTMHVDVSIKVPDAMNLQQNATNFTALFCVNARSSKLWPHVKIDFIGRIVIDPEENRAKLKDDTEYDITIAPGDENCDEQIVEVMTTADLSKPISMKFNLEVNEYPIEISDLQHAARLEENSILETTLDIQLTRDCGEDLICKPLLEMTLEPLNSPYVPGSEHRLGLKVTVLNKEEPSYGAKVHLIVPSSPKRLPTECSLQNLNVTCSLPAPLMRMNSVVFEIELEYIPIDRAEDLLIIKARLQDPLYEDSDIERAFQELDIVITPKANFAISGKSLPNATILVTRDKLHGDENITFVHQYEIMNWGPSDWYRLRVQIILSEKVNMSTRLKECWELDRVTHCEWKLPAKVSLPVVLPLRFDLHDHGEFLEKKVVYNITSTMTILLEAQNKSVSTITTLILEPEQPYWPVIVGCIAGLLLLSAIITGFYKCGFFSRKRIEDFQRLQEHQADGASASDANISVGSLAMQLMVKCNRRLLFNRNKSFYNAYSNMRSPSHCVTEDDLNKKTSSIVDFYNGKSIFITGGTGFLGKMYIRNILHRCPGICKIYMLIRPTSKNSVESRLEDMIKNSD